jgi:phospholipase C
MVGAFPLASVPAGLADQLTEGRKHLRHVIIIMQENRSFDHYFGTFPGADGFPRDGNGKIAVCIPLDPRRLQQGCVVPYHDRHTVNKGGSHQFIDAINDIDYGAMDGFIATQSRWTKTCTIACRGIKAHDVVGYHTESEIPSYWAYAKNFVLEDHLFESVQSWSMISHFYLVSEWSAKCGSSDPFSCKTDIDLPFTQYKPKNLKISWTNITFILDEAHVSWKYYLAPGFEPDCADDSMFCNPPAQSPGVPGIWNPLPYFTTFKDASRSNRHYAADHTPTTAQFFADLNIGKLPSVAWLVPNSVTSEHPPNDIKPGLRYVTTVVNAVMKSSYWPDVAIFIAWDDWGGFYDHVVPPVSDEEAGVTLGYGLRVPGLIISGWAKRGFIDHETVSFDAYNRLIEDLFLNSRRLDPATDDRPDPRPTVRDALTSVLDRMTGKKIRLGNLLDDFDFGGNPLDPLVLPVY